VRTEGTARRPPRPRSLAYRKLRPGIPPTFISIDRSESGQPPARKSPQLVARGAPLHGSRPAAAARAAAGPSSDQCQSALPDQTPPIAAVLPIGAAPIAVAAEPASNALLMRGDYWEVSYDGSSSILDDCRGLRYIAILIRDTRANQNPLHAKELVALASGQWPGPIEVETRDALLDHAARIQLTRRLEEVAFERNRAEDDETAAALDEEYERIASALTEGTATRGRRGSFTDGGEKARKAVGKAITEAVSKIAACPGLFPLAEHLGSAVRKGLWLSYTGSAEWEIDFRPPVAAA
jgi:hypothetical protein